MATQNRRNYSNPHGSSDIGSGVRTTVGGSYRNPRLGIEDYTAWSKMNIQLPSGEKEKLKFKELSVFGDELDPFSTTDDGESWNLNREFGILLNNNFKEGELSLLGKNYEKGNKNIQDRIQGHLSGYHAAFGESGAFNNYVSQYTDAQVYDHNVSSKWLPNENGENSGLTYAQLAKDSNVNPNDWEYYSKPNKNGIMHYGMRKKSTGQFFSASALTPEWLEENFNVKADLTGDVQVSILKDGSAQGYKGVKPSYNTAGKSVTITLPDGQTVETDKTEGKWIRPEWYTRTNTFAQTFANKKYASKYDATYKSAWYQLDQKFQNGSFRPNSALEAEMLTKYNIDDISKLGEIDISNEDRIKLLRDEAQEEFKVLNGVDGYVRDERKKIKDPNNPKNQIDNPNYGRALSKNLVQWNKDTITKEADEETSSVGSAAVNIFDAIKGFVGEGTMAGAHKNIGTFKQKEIDLPQAVDYLNRTNESGYSFFSLYDEEAIKDVLAKDQLKSKDRKMINDIIRQKTPGQKGNRLIAYMDNNDDLQVTNFDGTIGSFVSNVALYGPYNDKQRLQIQNSVDEMIAQKRDIPKYTETE